ncbi:hypothetical protein HUJ05_001517 [Dendroctonus ponderosae]|nr:hypothetical protein HUJ05_001517 [Dendroctonus ponderosae]
MFIVSGMTFVALMIYSLGFLKMEQVKIGKCNWTSYDMADSSINMKVLLINNRRVFRFIKHLDKSIRYVVLVDVLLNSISIAALATNITNDTLSIVMQGQRSDPYRKTENTKLLTGLILVLRDM